MSKIKILLFGGTTEGRELAWFLKYENIALTVYVATSYGAELLEAMKQQVVLKRLEQAEIKELLEKQSYDLVVDATHPFAALITQYIKMACAQTNTAYMRIIRGQRAVRNGVSVDTIEEAVTYLQAKEGNVLVTTGSKVIEPFTKLKDYKERVYIRLLPIGEQIEKCRLLGFPSAHLIAMQGPFSQEMNECFLMHTQARYLITKESGDLGGLDEKIKACEKRGVQIISINRPTEEKGYVLEEAKALLKAFINQ